MIYSEIHSMDEIPKCCLDCVLSYFESYSGDCFCAPLCMLLSDDMMHNQRPNSCPLIELPGVSVPTPFFDGMKYEPAETVSNFKNGVYIVGKQIKEIPPMTKEKMEQIKKDVKKYLKNDK